MDEAGDRNPIGDCCSGNRCVLDGISWREACIGGCSVFMRPIRCSDRDELWNVRHSSTLISHDSGRRKFMAPEQIRSFNPRTTSPTECARSVNEFRVRVLLL